MTIEASAPGKLVLLGEYAVLDGAPALVVAVQRRARVRLTRLADGPSRLRSRPLLEREVEFEWPHPGRLSWQAGLSAAERGHLAWLGLLIEGLAECGCWPGEPVAVELDTGEFHAADGNKLGLGSSAALTVALAGAGAQAAGGDPDALSLDQLVSLHRRLQRGRGSGIDVAAGFHGGVVRYRLVKGRASAERVRLPPGISLLALASGTAVSTPAALEQLQDWSDAHPDRWAELRHRLLEAAEQGATAIDQGAEALESALAAFGECMAELESASGLQVYGSAHRPILQLARDRGVTYKPSGAGGDLGIAASRGPQRIDSLRRAAARNRVACIEIDGSADGLYVRSHPDGEPQA